MAEERTILPALDFPPAVIITKIFACADSIIVGALMGLKMLWISSKLARIFW
jgi:hypothetical protein